MLTLGSAHRNYSGWTLAEDHHTICLPHCMAAELFNLDCNNPKL